MCKLSRDREVAGSLNRGSALKFCYRRWDLGVLYGKARGRVLHGERRQPRCCIKDFQLNCRLGCFWRKFVLLMLDIVCVRI